MCKTMNPAQMHGPHATRSLSQRLMGKLATLLSRRNLLRLSGWLPFLIFRYAVLAEKTAAPHLEYTRTVWRVSDGLPEDTDRNHGWAGAVRGTHIQIYGQGMAQPLSVNSIFCVALRWAKTAVSGRGLREEAFCVCVATG
jgi:hypothetical protein